MSLRIDYTKTQREIYRAMGGVGRAVAGTGLERSLIELVNIRASQINGCAYCLSLHIPDALDAGVTQEQINLLSAWHECGDLYSERERAALQWAERNTRIADGDHDDEAWAAVTAVFSEDEAMALTWAIAAINTWNRIAIPMRRPIIRSTAAPG
ncbi:MAG TPA: carboxymuconolactone decarboxylase family protein [Thermomicrobiales bacterium]|nr:carboxymuconolactone decarboxylase family protein [Thermomicrobiales bacterium]